jgi:hypothetical protein
MARAGPRKSQEETPAPKKDRCLPARFPVHVRNDNRERTPPLVRLKAVCGPGDDGEPVFIKGLEVVAEGPTWTGDERQSHYTATIYPGPKGNFVFNASTIFCAQGLSAPPGHMPPISHHGRPHGPDERVQRITRNVLEKFRGG